VVVLRYFVAVQACVLVKGPFVEERLNGYLRRRDLNLQSSTSLGSPGRGVALDGLVLVTFGPEVRVQVPAATQYNAALSRPFPHVFPTIRVG